MKTRDNLKEQLKKFGLRIGAINACCEEVDIATLRGAIADFIMADRERIVKCIIKITQDQKDLHSRYSMTRKGTCDELMEQFNKLLE